MRNRRANGFSERLSADRVELFLEALGWWLKLIARIDRGCPANPPTQVHKRPRRCQIGEAILFAIHRMRQAYDHRRDYLVGIGRYIAGYAPYQASVYPLWLAARATGRLMFVCADPRDRVDERAAKGINVSSFPRFQSALLQRGRFGSIPARHNREAEDKAHSNQAHHLKLLRRRRHVSSVRGTLRSHNQSNPSRGIVLVDLTLTRRSEIE